MVFYSHHHDFLCVLLFYYQKGYFRQPDILSMLHYFSFSLHIVIVDHIPSPPCISCKSRAARYFHWGDSCLWCHISSGLRENHFYFFREDTNQPSQPTMERDFGPLCSSLHSTLIPPCPAHNPREFERRSLAVYVLTATHVGFFDTAFFGKADLFDPARLGLGLLQIVFGGKPAIEADFEWIAAVKLLLPLEHRYG